jgi:hypothetical protein
MIASGNMARRSRPDADELELTGQLGLRPSPEIEEEVIRIAAGLERAKTWVGYRLMLKGLAQYRKDKDISIPSELSSGAREIKVVRKPPRK